MKNGWKAFSIIAGLFITLGTVAAGYGELKEKAHTTEFTIKEVKVEVKENEEDIVDISLINVEQTIILKQISKSLDKLEKKLDK